MTWANLQFITLLRALTKICEQHGRHPSKYVSVGMLTVRSSQYSQIDVQMQHLILSGTQNVQQQERAVSILAAQRDQLNDLFARIEESRQTQQKLAEYLGDFRQASLPPPYEPSRPFSLDKPGSRNHVSGLPEPASKSKIDKAVVNISEKRQQPMQDTSQLCSPSCQCSCHKKTRWSSPWSAKRLLGALYITYTGISMLSPRCSIPLCKRKSPPIISINCSLPRWLASYMISIFLKSAPACSPE